jgi:adenosylcobinamide amidohydrolase
MTGPGGTTGPSRMTGPGGTTGAVMPNVRLLERVEDGVGWPVLVWEAGPGWRMISSGVVGGGIGERSWWLNAGVPRDYARRDVQGHLTGIAQQLGLGDPARWAAFGVGMLTAADVRSRTRADDGGVHAVATVGLGAPVQAAAAPERVAGEAAVVGTINILAVVPAPLTDAALVNAVLTVTEAKTQALVEHGVPGTGTSSDAVCIACPVPDGRVDGVAPAAEPFGGPRSTWGARLARAVHAAVGEGTARWLAHHPDGDQHRRWSPTSSCPHHLPR